MASVIRFKCDGCIHGCQSLALSEPLLSRWEKSGDRELCKRVRALRSGNLMCGYCHVNGHFFFVPFG